jgi:hypothetical protein
MACPSVLLTKKPPSPHDLYSWSKKLPGILNFNIFPAWWMLLKYIQLLFWQGVTQLAKWFPKMNLHGQSSFMSLIFYLIIKGVSIYHSV